MEAVPSETSQVDATPQDPAVARIVTAARGLFFEQGLRATTMAEIAKAAGMAKPTLYARFPDKEAVFRAVVGEIMLRLGARVEAGLAGAGPAAERIATALAGKYVLLDELIGGSSHVDELMQGNLHYAGQEYAALDLRVRTAVAQVLVEAGADDPDWLAGVLLACAEGISRRSPGIAAVTRDIHFAIGRLVVL